MILKIDLVRVSKSRAEVCRSTLLTDGPRNLWRVFFLSVSSSPQRGQPVAEFRVSCSVPFPGSSRMDY